MSAVARQSASLTRNVTRPPKPRIVPPGDVVIRVRLEAGIVDLLDPRMAFEELGHALAVFVVPLHPQLERLQAAAQQVAILRAVDGAHDAAQLADRLQLFRRADDHAGQQVVVAGEVLGGRVQHVIDAGRDRPQVVGRGQRGVDQRFDAVLAADLRRSDPDRRCSSADWWATR